MPQTLIDRICPTTGKYNMGMGALGDSSVEPRRKFRYLFQISFCQGRVIPPYFVKMVGRPDLTVEDFELNFLNSRTWITGKPSWETISVTYMDIETGQNAALWSWIGTVYNFFNNGNGVGVNQNRPCYSMGRRVDYEGTATIQSLDGCGGVTEEWMLYNVFPQSIKFGEYDYSDNGTVDIEMTLRYSNVAYRNYCGDNNINPCVCTGCGVLPGS